MEIKELLAVLKRGEDTTHQFKQRLDSALKTAQEICALSNSSGGQILVGVRDDGTVSGLSQGDVRTLNQYISNACSQNLRPAVNPTTQLIDHPDGLVMVVTVPQGISKPYMDSDGITWVKCGADKRRVTAREELQRLFQESRTIQADEIPVPGFNENDIDTSYFENFFRMNFKEMVKFEEKTPKAWLENLNFMRDGYLNVAGALLFG